MKKSLTTLFLVWMYALAFPQTNYVADSSFENCSAPDTCVLWRYLAGYPINLSLGNPNPQYDIPWNIYGSEYAAHQEHYMKIVMETPANYREYIGIEFSTPIPAGSRVAASFSVSRADYCQLACNNMGIAFRGGSWGIPGPIPAGGPDSVLISTVVLQDTGWYNYRDTFVTPTYIDRITIGNHRTFAETSVTVLHQNCGISAAIYFVDDIKVYVLPPSPLTSVKEEEKKEETLLRATNMFGQEIPLDSKGFKILWYSNGTRKVYE